MKLIGITAWPTGPNSLGITVPYFNFLRQFGMVLPLTPSEGNLNGLDLIVLPGGPAVNPIRYGEKSKKGTLICMIREYFDLNNLPLYINSNIPVLGICRGHESLAVYFGSKLIRVEEKLSKDRKDLTHEVELIRDMSFLNKDLTLNYKFNVNSIHVKAVDPQNISDELEIIAINTTTGNIEAIKHREKEVYGIQWHPEEINDDYSINLIKYLLKL